MNIGQGLIQWQSIAFKMGANVLKVKRESEMIRPYSSFKEFGFYRGIATTINFRKYDCTLFFSRKKIDATIIQDTLGIEQGQVSSLYASGLHRTYYELSKKNREVLTVLGSNILKSCSNYKFGLSAVLFQFALPVQSKTELYNKFDFSGYRQLILGANYEYTVKNFHFFGECAAASFLQKATVIGLIASVSKNIDVAFLHRNISRAFQSFYTNAFIENTSVNNEIGNYLGISYLSFFKWKIDFFYDIYRNPWVKFGNSKTTNGKMYLISAARNFGKTTKLQILIRNSSLSDVTVMSTISKTTHAKISMNTILGPANELSQTIQMVRYFGSIKSPEDGFLIATEYKTTLLNRKLEAQIKLTFFDTDSYNSRIFLLESDGFNRSTSGLFYDQGVKVSGGMDVRISKKVHLGGKLSNLSYFEKKSIGYGQDLIKSNKKTSFSIKILIKN